MDLPFSLIRHWFGAWEVMALSVIRLARIGMQSTEEVGKSKD